MSDAAFKGNVELTFLHNLQGIKSVCFLSATPIPEDYLGQMDDFDDVQTYYQLVWNSSVMKPSNLLSLPYGKGNTSRSICKWIIEDFRQNGYFAQKIVNGKIVQSHEVCIFLNDVKSIISIISENGLNPDDVNVLCSQSNAGLSTLRNKGVHVGELCTDPSNPQNRTFTFCTKSAFEGVDFYSDNAYTYIFSDGVLDWNKHDLIIDVPQILGRQRLVSNPFRTDATLYYRTQSTTESQQEASTRIQAKVDATERWIENYNKAPNEIKKMLVDGVRNMDVDKKYETNYVDVVDDTLHGGFIVKPNYLMLYVEIRDWQLSSFVYSNPIYLISTLDACTYTPSNQPISEKDTILLQFKEQFFRQRSISKQIDIYCSFLQTYPDTLEELWKNPHIPLFFHEAYQLIGPQRLSTLQYRESNIQSELNFIKAKGQIIIKCHESFQSGQYYPPSHVKSTLQTIYKSLNLTQIASASDLGLYISFTQKQLTNKETGKRELFYIIK